MAKTGFRVDVKRWLRKLAKSKNVMRAEAFRPELSAFAKASLQTAAQNTPVRDLAVIRAAQKQQYSNRINYIPSVHTLEDPSLRVTQAGKHWLYMGGVWILANEYRRLSEPQWTAYNSLMYERERRMQTIERAFINERTPARFLYRASWYQVADSLGLKLRSNSNIQGAHSRRSPRVAPPRGYGQWRGGDKVISVVIYNPFLEQPSGYKPWSGKDILDPAMLANEPEFKRKVNRKMEKLLSFATK